ncbi:protein FAR1-RELATED SEQUENCE 5 isoform X1 [Triticum aestivum]|uniref:protein FAR1-RELATED SEQUENCE 5 isoform X1 n=1 Tax=Triticum aestivum TaxID=4565 RepID=UPI0008451404|nr:protein FAR1-RELATED SEQUENCE 5-like isoform X1 [Triticum aestivum]
MENDPGLFFKCKTDAEGGTENLFWVDGAARKAYTEAYHDCVSFDATYLTNMYNMLFAPFIGINRHGQSIMLGCGFVRQELASSYDWLFDAFLEAMDGLAPDNIITDQDVAMAQSIKRKFPAMIHRCCGWHIMKKAQEKLGPVLARNPDLVKDFNECIDFSFTSAEFERKRAALQWKYEGLMHGHFEKLYEDRATWVPCYFKFRFFPFLQSTQCSEGFNAVLKRYVNPHKSILNFVKQYEKIQVHILVREDGNDYRTKHLEAQRWSRFPIERHAYKAYTRDIYVKFRTEFQMIGQYDVCPARINFYYLEPNTEEVLGYGSRKYLVTVRPEPAIYDCECCKWHRDGMLCCHVLKIFTHLGVNEIPEHYIKRRWMQHAVPSAPPPPNKGPPHDLPAELENQVRQVTLTMDFAKLAKKAMTSDEAAAVVRRHMKAADTEVTKLNKLRKKRLKAAREAARAREASNPNAPSTSNQPPAPLAPMDPPHSVTKGRSRSKRFKSALELHPKKKNKCSICESIDHTAATCLGKLM